MGRTPRWRSGPVPVFVADRDTGPGTFTRSSPGAGSWCTARSARPRGSARAWRRCIAGRSGEVAGGAVQNVRPADGQAGPAPHVVDERDDAAHDRAPYVVDVVPLTERAYPAAARARSAAATSSGRGLVVLSWPLNRLAVPARQPSEFLELGGAPPGGTVLTAPARRVRCPGLTYRGRRAGSAARPGPACLALPGRWRCWQGAWPRRRGCPGRRPGR